MGLSIFSNVPSLQAQRNLGKTQGALMGNLARLSSGMRINSAADDAAGLAISERLSPRSAASPRQSATPTTASASSRRQKAP